MRGGKQHTSHEGSVCLAEWTETADSSRRADYRTGTRTGPRITHDRLYSCSNLACSRLVHSSHVRFFRLSFIHLCDARRGQSAPPIYILLIGHRTLRAPRIRQPSTRGVAASAYTMHAIHPPSRWHTTRAVRPALHRGMSAQPVCAQAWNSNSSLRRDYGEICRHSPFTLHLQRSCQWRRC